MGKRSAVFTEGLVAKFLHLIANNGGNVTAACRDLGISRDMMYEHRKESPDFKKRWDSAVDRGVDLLEDEARRRALEGAEEPIYYKGRKVGYVYKKSDFLLAMMLRAHRAAYRDKHELTGPDGQPLGTNVVVYLPSNGRDDVPPGPASESDPTRADPMPPVMIGSPDCPDCRVSMGGRCPKHV